MRSNLLAFTAVLAIGSSTLGQGRVVITEIMYNPNSEEKGSATEWVEIANVGTEAVALKDWRLDDEDKDDWAKFSCTLAPGGVAVLINGSKVTEAQFRAAWDPASGSADAAAAPVYQVIPVKWGGLANVPGADNEVLQLLDDKNAVICEVRQAGAWPKLGKGGGPSIWLNDFKATNVSDGKLWKRSEPGKDGAHENTKTDIFNGKDCGSPGYVHGLSPAPAVTPAAPTGPATVPAATQPAESQKDKPKDGNKIEY